MSIAFILIWLGVSMLVGAGMARTFKLVNRGLL